MTRVSVVFSQLSLLWLTLWLHDNVQAFAPHPMSQRRSKSRLDAAFQTPPPPPPSSIAVTNLDTTIVSTSPLESGIANFVGSQNQNAWSSSSVSLSVQEYRKPTPEELAAKKRNFNLWFWGGTDETCIELRMLLCGRGEF